MVKALAAIFRLCHQLKTCKFFLVPQEALAEILLFDPLPATEAHWNPCINSTTTPAFVGRPAHLRNTSYRGVAGITHCGTVFCNSS
jgi:hypothetical protein